MSRASRFERFITAQLRHQETACRELEAGHKTSHWIWYIFPIQTGPEWTSSRCHEYAIVDGKDAVSYLARSDLRKNLLDITKIAERQLCTAKLKPSMLMGSSIDAKKLAASMALFTVAAEHALPSLPPDGEHAVELQQLLVSGCAILDVLAAESAERRAYIQLKRDGVFPVPSCTDAAAASAKK